MRQMIVDRVQLFAAEMPIDIRRGLVQREMLACLKRVFENLGSQVEERGVPVSRGFNLRSADLTGAEMIGHCQHVRSR